MLESRMFFIPQAIHGNTEDNEDILSDEKDIRHAFANPRLVRIRSRWA